MSQPTEDLVIPWKPQEITEGYPSWIKHKYPVEIFESNSKRWFNAIIYDILPYNPSKKSKKYNRVEVYTYITETKTTRVTVNYSEIESKLRPSNVLFPKWIAPNVKALFYTEKQNMWQPCIISKYNDGEFIQIKYTRSDHRHLHQKDTTFTKKLKFDGLKKEEIQYNIKYLLVPYTDGRYEILDTCYLFPPDIINLLKTYLPDDETVRLYPGFQNVSKNQCILYDKRVEETDRKFFGIRFQVYKRFLVDGVEMDFDLKLKSFKFKLMKRIISTDWHTSTLYKEVGDAIGGEEETSYHGSYCKFVDQVLLEPGYLYFLSLQPGNNSVYFNASHTRYNNFKSRKICQDVTSYWDRIKRYEYIYKDSTFTVGHWLYDVEPIWCNYKGHMITPWGYRYFESTEPKLNPKFIPQFRLCVNTHIDNN